MPDTIRRSTLLAGITAATTAAAWPNIARAQAQTVRVGILRVLTDAPYFVADKKRFWRDEGLDVQFSPFASSNDMVVPFSQGTLDAGGGAAAAALYNGVARGLTSRLVADRASDAPGFGFSKLLVRSDLVKSGRFKTMKDLKGMIVAGNEPGTGSSASLFFLLQKYGLTWADVNRQSLSFPMHVAALANGKVDASYTTEPDATIAIENGSAVKIMSNDQWYPNQQISAVLYGGEFLKKADLAQKFMRGYLRGARFYHSTLQNGTFAGPNADEVVSILNDSLPQKEAGLYRKMTPPYVGPDANFNLLSLKRDLDYFRSQNLVQSPTIGVNDIIDTSFHDRTVKELGPYKPPR